MNPSAVVFNKTISNRDKFGYWLKNTREEFGYGMNEFAEMIGMSAGYLSDIERGNRNAPLNHLSKISEIFHIPENQIMYLTDLAGCGRRNWQDINDYLAEHKPARDAMRAAKNANLSDEEFLEIFLKVLSEEQRADFINDLLAVAEPQEQEALLVWLETILEPTPDTENAPTAEQTQIQEPSKN